MKRLFAILPMLLAAVVAVGGDFQWTWQNAAGLPEKVRSMTLFPLVVSDTNGVHVAMDTITRPTDGNSAITISNLLGGNYRVEFTGANRTTTNWYQFPATNGLQNAWAYRTNQPTLNASHTFATVQLVNTASNALQVEIDNVQAGGLAYSPQLGSASLTNWSALPTNVLGTIAASANLTNAPLYGPPIQGSNSVLSWVTNVQLIPLPDNYTNLTITGAGTTAANGTYRWSNGANPNQIQSAFVRWTNSAGNGYALVGFDGAFLDNWVITNASGQAVYESALADTVLGVYSDTTDGIVGSAPSPTVALIPAYTTNLLAGMKLTSGIGLDVSGGLITGDLSGGSNMIYAADIKYPPFMARTLEPLMTTALASNAFVFTGGPANTQTGYMAGLLYHNTNLYLGDFSLMAPGILELLGSNQVYQIIAAFAATQVAGIFPNAIDKNGNGVQGYLAGSMDPHAFVTACYNHYRLCGQPTAYTNFYSNITNGLAHMSLSNHLVWTTNVGVNGSVEFYSYDTAPGLGYCAIGSVNRYAVYQQLAAMAAASGDAAGATNYAAELPLISSNLVRYLWDSTSGLLFAASGTATHDLWATAWGVVLGAIAGPQHGEVIRTFISSNSVFATPYGGFCKFDTGSHSYYPFGAPWYAAVLADSRPDLAMSLMHNTVASLVRTRGAEFWNAAGDGTAGGANDYYYLSAVTVPYDYLRNHQTESVLAQAVTTSGGAATNIYETAAGAGISITTNSLLYTVSVNSSVVRQSNNVALASVYVGTNSAPLYDSSGLVYAGGLVKVGNGITMEANGSATFAGAITAAGFTNSSVAPGKLYASGPDNQSVSVTVGSGLNLSGGTLTAPLDANINTNNASQLSSGTIDPARLPGGLPSGFPLSGSTPIGGQLLLATPIGTNAASGNGPMTWYQGTSTVGTNTEIEWSRGWNTAQGNLVDTNHAGLAENVEMNWDPINPSNVRQIEYYFTYSSRSNLFGNRPFAMVLRETNNLQANFAVDVFHLDGPSGINDSAAAFNVSRLTNGGANLNLNGNVIVSNNAVASGAVQIYGSGGLLIQDPTNAANISINFDGPSSGIQIVPSTNVLVHNARLWTWQTVTNDFQGDVKLNGNDMRLVNAKDLVLGGNGPTDGNYTSIRGNNGNDTIFSRAYTAFKWQDTHSGPSGGVGVNVMGLDSATGNLAIKGSVNATNGFIGDGSSLTNLALKSVDWSQTNTVTTNNVALKIPVLTNNGVPFYLILFTNGP